MNLFFARRARGALLSVLFAIALCSHAWAVDALSLDDLMRATIARNHDLKAARAQVRAALGRMQQAGLRPNPRIEFAHDTDVLFGNDGEYSASVGVALDLPITGRLARARDVARVDVAAAVAEVNEAERLLLGQVAAAYYEVVALNQRLVLLDRLLGIDQSMVAVATQRFRAGEVSQLDVSAAAIEVARMQQQRMALHGQRSAALNTLAGLVGYEVSATPIINDRAPEIAAPASPPELLARAIALRPDLRLRALSIDRANAEQALAKAAAWQDWTMSLGVRQDKLDIRGAPGQPTSHALLFTVAVPLPLFNKNQGTLAANRADADAAQEQLAALTLRIQNDIAGRHTQLTRLFDVLRAYREQTLPLGRRNTALAQDAYRKGQAAILEVVQAQRQENELNTSYADATAQYLQLFAALDTATVTNTTLMTHVTDTGAATSMGATTLGEHQ